MVRKELGINSVQGLDGGTVCVAAGTTIVGPSMVGVADRAGTRVPGLDGRAYLRQSIVDPDAHVVDGFEEGKMPQIWADILTDVQIDALIDYLLELS